MWYALYNLGLVIASPIVLLILLAKPRCRRGLAQRFGRLPSDPRDDRPLVWIHAVSLGEVTAAAPLVQRLHRRLPQIRIIVTTVTETGREAVEQRLAGVAEHRYAPLDFPWVVARVVRQLRPSLFLFVETELWPNLLRTLARHAVPVALVNGRLSSRSFRRYRWLRPFMRQVLSAVHACLMQSPRDAERIEALGAPADRVVSTGNIKFDQPMPAMAQCESLPREALLHPGEELIVAGSTHPGEEETLIAAYVALRQQFPSLVLLLAPRHIERAGRVEASVRERGLVALRRSRLSEPPPAGARVIVLDTRGELAAVYRHAAVTFVGGTLVPVGGHNLLEPATWDKPVLFGPHTDHCADIAALLLKAGGGRQVQNEDELIRAIEGCLRTPPQAKEMGQAAGRVVTDNRGALDRTLAKLDAILPLAMREPMHPLSERRRDRGAP